MIPFMTRDEELIKILRRREVSPLESRTHRTTVPANPNILQRICRFKSGEFHIYIYISAHQRISARCAKATRKDVLTQKKLQ